VPSRADVYDIRSGASFEIISSSSLPYAGISISYTFTGGNYDGSGTPDPYVGPYYGYQITVQGIQNGFVFLQEQTCFENQSGSLCGRLLHTFYGAPQLTNGQATFYVGSSVEENGNITPVNVDICVDIPSGSEVIINGIVVTAVPELSTWAMLLIGFAGIGFAYRRRAVRNRLSINPQSYVRVA
jgi:hypothetical protein